MVTFFFQRILTKDRIASFQYKTDWPLFLNIAIDFYIFLVIIHMPGVEF